jgi:very-short-patch-repair endonuclease
MPAIIRGQKISRAKLQRAKELREEMTEAEKILWNLLRRNGLHGLHFRRQQIIEGYIVDFYCHAANIIVEVDGEVHDFQVAEDKYRDQALKEKGFKVIRFKNEEIHNNVQEVLAKIAIACGYKSGL